jgi:HEAT repeat protein
MKRPANPADAVISKTWQQLARLFAADVPGPIRASALASVVREAPRATSAPLWRQAAVDPDPKVRLRAAQLAPGLGRSATSELLAALLADDDAWVAEAAAFAIGEHPRPARVATDALAAAAAQHDDPLVREAAVAALGARGDPATLPIVLHACDDKPTIRRRAVIALAAFEGPEVEARLRVALDDRDWQVRHAAEDLLHEQVAE